MGRRGLALSKLNDNIFNEVVQRRMPISRAVAMPRLFRPRAANRRSADLLRSEAKNGNNISDGEVQELARIVQSAPTVTTRQINLFGEEDLRQNLAVEKAQLSNWVKNQLREEKNAYRPVSSDKRAAIVSDRGNRLNVVENRARGLRAQQDLEVYGKLSLTAGPVADALNAAAERIAKGESNADVRARLFREVQAGIRRTVPRRRGNTRPS